ncbi:MAG: 3-dehydroquinate synthase [Phycisphaerales bacterium]|nr:3-dehydroquinate synthase [Phycisphaerales bacterium]
MITLRCVPPDATGTEVRVGVDLTDGLAQTLADLGPSARFTAVVDRRVAELHPARTRGVARALAIDGGEASKSFGALEHLLREFARADLDRGAGVVAIGGGTVGDLAGLAAALYARGLDLIQVPTTLLAMVDSSVGGKTAINLPEGKNLVGVIHPATRVLIDLGFLATLPDAEFRSGLGELLKVGLGLSAELCQLLRQERDAVLARDPATLTRAVALAIGAKIALVEADLRERGPRRLLNLGHTLGHALEAESHWALAHGLAVARGLHFAVRVAHALGMLPTADATAARALLVDYGFAADPLPPPTALMPFLRRDKKVAGAKLHFVVPTGLGQSTVIELPWADLERQLTDEVRG